MHEASMQFTRKEIKKTIRTLERERDSYRLYFLETGEVQWKHKESRLAARLEVLYQLLTADADIFML